MKFRFTFKKFLRVTEFDIEAFSFQDAIDKFYANFPRSKILYIEEVTNEPK